jgi:hypothetical protein
MRIDRPREYSGDISGSRNISWMCLQYSLQRFEHALALSTPNVIPWPFSENLVALGIGPGTSESVARNSDH